MAKIRKLVSGGAFATNTYLIIKDDKCVVIDPGLDFKEIAAEILATYEVDKVLITHGHLDHIDGIRYLNAPVYISEFDYEMLFESNVSLYKMIGQKNPLKLSVEEVYKLKDSDTIQIFEKSLKVIHTPGHTKGSICFLYEDNLFTGDTLFYESYGRTDFPTGNMNELRKSMAKILSLDSNITVYPGHDQKTTIRHERKNNPLS